MVPNATGERRVVRRAGAVPRPARPERVGGRHVPCTRRPSWPLAGVLAAGGHEVVNEVNCRKPLDRDLFATVRAAFAPHFPRLRTVQTTQRGIA